MIIITSDELLGDALCTLPAIWEAAQTQKIYLISRNQEVAELLPYHDNIVLVKSLNDIFYIPNAENEKNYTLHSSKAWHQFVSTHHMSQAHYDFLGLPIPNEVPTCPLETENTNVTAYDFLISAGSRSDCNNNKLWNYSNWQQIIDWLVEKDFHVAALMSARTEEHNFDNCDNLSGLPLKMVGTYIKNVKKAVISIDNGLSHYVRILGINHVLLYPQALPEHWVANPKAISIQKAPLNLTVDEVKTLLLPFL